MIWFYLSAGAAMLLSFLTRGRAGARSWFTRMLSEEQKAVFAQILPAHIRPYAEIILRVSREQSVNAFLIVALGERESRWGRALDADMRGDSKYGHGIMQIDVRYWGDWLAANNWRDPYTNVTKGIQILKQKMAVFADKTPIRVNAGDKAQTISDGTYVYLPAAQAARRNVQPGAYLDPRPLRDIALIRAALAAYNTGEANVLYSIAVGLSPDFTTAGGNYGHDVLTRAGVLEAKARLG